MGNVIHLTEENFESEVLKSDVPVVVDFWATWCGPCQMQGPIIEQLADEGLNIKVCKLDVDKCMNIAKQYRVMSIPTICVFEGGKVVAQNIGLTQLDDLIDMIG